MFSILAAAVSTLSWALYFVAQYRGKVASSPVYWGASALVTLNDFLATRAFSSSLEAMSFAPSVGGCIILTVWNARRPWRLSGHDAAVGGGALVALSVVRQAPGVVLAGSLLFTLVSYSVYLRQLRTGAIRETPLPWVLSAIANALMILGMAGNFGLAWTLPGASLVGCAAVAALAARGHSRTPNVA